jgi:diguanylate cyclase (GGDEF)-like protein
MRALQVAQLSVLLLLAALTTLAAIAATRVVRDHQAQDALSRGALFELGQARDGLRGVEADFWRGRTGGRPVTLTLDAFASIARARAGLVKALEDQGVSLGQQSASVAAGGEALRQLDRIVSVAARGVGARAGSEEEEEADARVSALIDPLDTAMRAWGETTGRDQARHEADLAAGQRRAVTIVFTVLAAFGIGGLAVWVLLERARRRVVDALVEATDEQLALRRVATSVMRGDCLDDTLALVARELGELSGALACEVVRLPPGPGLRALWIDPRAALGIGPRGLGTLPVVAPPGTASERLHVWSLPASGGLRDRRLVAAGVRSVASAPILAGGAVWGGIGVGLGDPELPADTRDRIERFAELAAIVIEQERGRARLSAEATTDHLTGLANHRVFHERVTAEMTAAQLGGTPLSLAVLDLDDFRRVNDVLGHHVGDEVLVEVARRLLRIARAGDLVARIGGEEFAWLMPGTDGLGAFAAAERARHLIGSRPLTPGVSATVSVGLCDRERAEDAAELVRLADGALYWAKHHGRDLVCLYSPETVREISDAERVEYLERARSLEALRALARAVDARDPYTQRHSERVALLAHRIAAALGWSEGRAEELREAALVHDVGKVGVPDAILLKPGPLDDAEYEQVRGHAELGAQIVADILSAEAATWVRGHHERLDGNGYPDGLQGDDIPEGARILALADSWDAMTTDRPYHRALGAEQALDECRRSAGSQLWPTAVAALELLTAADASAAQAQEVEGARSPGWISPVS